MRSGSAGSRWAATPPVPRVVLDRSGWAWVVPALAVVPPCVAAVAVSGRGAGALVLPMIAALSAAAIWFLRGDNRHPLVIGAAASVAGGAAIGIAWPGSHVVAVLLGLWLTGALVAAGALVRRDRPLEPIAGATRRLGDILRVVLLAPLSVLFVLIPWAIDRLLRSDPLASPGPTDTAWRRRRLRDVRPSDLWTTDAVAVRRTPVERLRAAARFGLSTVVAVGLLAGVSSAIRSIVGSDPIFGGGGEFDDIEIPAAYADSPWYRDYLGDISWVERPGTAWQPLQQHRIGDVRTRYVNVDQGVRRSWHPPECGCRRVVVWLYGGSTTFGLGQRDEHTIASELARVAWEHGIALDVDNRGVVGDVHWQEANRYAWDVATYGPPDGVVFYDGINDTSATQTLVNDRTGDRYAAVDFQNDDFWRRYLEQNPPDEPPQREGASVPTPSTVVEYDYGELLMTRYDRARKMSAATSAVHGTPTFYVWQGTRLSRPPVPGEPRSDDDFARERDRLIESVVPSDVINLVGVFRSTREPLFYDDQHHNELGARIVAEALFERLRPDLEAMAARPAPTTTTTSPVTTTTTSAGPATTATGAPTR